LYVYVLFGDPMNFTSSKHSEVALNFWSSFLDVVGALVLIVSVGAWVVTGFEVPAFLIPGIASAVSAFVASSVLRCLAEIVRVLKRSAGLPYAGSLGDDKEVPRTT
jgi:hypothetical protein